MKILGIDPGTRITGYGLIDKDERKIRHLDNGLIVNAVTATTPDKLYKIYLEVKRLIAEFKPDVVALEDIFVSQNVKSSLKLGQTRGVVMLAAAEAGIPVAEYLPTQVKQAVSNFGRANKEEVQKMVRLLLNLKEVAQEDASDALAVALCHASINSKYEIRNTRQR